MSSNVGTIITQNHETHIKGKTYVFTWVVKNLDFILPLTVAKCITSPPFRTEYGLFELKLYPGGVTDFYHNFVSLEIVNKTSISETSRAVISLVNMNGEEDFHYSTLLEINDDGHYQKVDKFVKRCNITSDFLPNDHLTLKWKLYFYDGAESFESLPTIQSMQNPAETHRLAELDDFEKLLKDNRFSDVKILIGTQTFYAHKNILAARSRYFAAMFDSTMKEEEEGEIRISNISANVMQEILRFIYTGKIDVEITMIIDLLISADVYGLDGLITICEEAVIRNMSLENIGSILNVIDLISGVQKLKDSAIEFLTKNGKEVSGSESLRKALNTLSPSFMAEVINIMISKI